MIAAGFVSLVLDSSTTRGCVILKQLGGGGEGEMGHGVMFFDEHIVASGDRIVYCK